MTLAAPVARAQSADAIVGDWIAALEQADPSAISQWQAPGFVGFGLVVDRHSGVTWEDYAARTERFFGSAQLDVSDIEASQTGDMLVAAYTLRVVRTEQGVTTESVERNVTTFNTSGGQPKVVSHVRFTDFEQ